jgi:hypothetical protein
VSLPVLGKTVVTDATGAFRITDIAPGPQQVRVRRLGYGVVDARLEFVADETLQKTVYLTRVTILDSVVTRTSALSDFEENRRVGLGRFFTREDIAKFDAGHLADVVAQAPGVRIIPGHSGQAWIASSRGIKHIGGKDSVSLEDRVAGVKPGMCYAQVYIDNALVYSSRAIAGRPEPLFDLNSIPPTSVEAIEYYAGAGQIPAKYMRLNSECGVVVIHTRR